MTKQTEIVIAKEDGLLVPQDKSVTALQVAPEEKPLIPDEKIVKLFNDTLDEVASDRKEAEERYLQYCDMVVNEGASSSAMIEATVNLLKLKHDALDRNIKILDLFTRMKLKERSTSSQVYAYQQNNKYEVANAPNQHVRELIKMATDLEKTE